MSPTTHCTFISVAGSPRESTHKTPTIDKAAPQSCWLRIDCLKNNAPMASMKTGLLEATNVTLMGEEVCKAKY